MKHPSRVRLNAGPTQRIMKPQGSLLLLQKPVWLTKGLAEIRSVHENIYSFHVFDSYLGCVAFKLKEFLNYILALICVHVHTLRINPQYERRYVSMYGVFQA